MGFAASEASGGVRRRWATLLALSAAFHVAVLSGLAFRMTPIRTSAQPTAMDVTMVAPPPFVRPLVIQDAKPPPQAKVVVLNTPPRYASQSAQTGDAGDAVDLFGPVFGDGMWPRPVLVKSEPCDPKDDPDARETCRRELLMIGLASDAVSGSKAAP